MAFQRTPEDDVEDRLFQALRMGEVPTIRRLLGTDTGLTALMELADSREPGVNPAGIAVQNGDGELLRLLQRHGLRPGGVDSDGFSLLHVLARLPAQEVTADHLHLAKHLIEEHGLHPDMPSPNCWTPLAMAVWEGHGAMAEVFARHRAAPAMTQEVPMWGALARLRTLTGLPAARESASSLKRFTDAKVLMSSDPVVLALLSPSAEGPDLARRLVRAQVPFSGQTFAAWVRALGILATGSLEMALSPSHLAFWTQHPMPLPPESRAAMDPLFLKVLGTVKGRAQAQAFHIQIEAGYRAPVARTTARPGVRRS
jgi:hypothetical protein